MPITRITSRRWLPGGFLLLIGGLTVAARPASAPPIPPSLYAGLVWRSVGPFRGGRVASVTGAIGQPGVFYMGLPLGGIWKTTSAGVTWFPVFDDNKEVSSVGAIQVAPSDPDIIYAGTGDLITGGGIDEGNGVYKSIDAGRSWQHIGLEESKQIPTILVDPRNADIALVAAQGNIRAPNTQRGLFRTTDGGKTWTRTLYVDSVTGLQNVAWAFDHPNVVIAATIQHFNGGGRGAGGGGGAAGGAGGVAPVSRTRLFKSTDEGVTWKEITGGGLPNLTGRLTLAVAMNTNAQRMYLVGPAQIGLWRSDDGGAAWRRMAANDARIANGQGNYSSGVYVDSKNPDIVYTIATTMYRSTDGGTTFTGFKGAPGGDDPQQLWIDPTDGKRMLLGTDQGATITQDGGENWSLWYNQPTSQVYHISVDNSYPYWIYGSQQDACAVATRSRGDLGEITPLDWLPNPASETGSVVADPLNPRIIYGLNLTVGIMKIMYPSGQWINVSPNIDTALNLRRSGDQPLIFSPTNPHELLAGFQYLMATTDGAAHWHKLSPDLTIAAGAPTPPAAPPAAAGRGGRGAAGGAAAGAGAGRGGGGGTIIAISPSSVAAGVIWVTTSNGLIKLTKNHGLTWEDVSIPDMPTPRGSPSAIDASHLDPATAYVNFDRHGSGDYTPWLYRTHDYGKTWTKIVSGMRTDQPSGSFSRVIRADTKKAGLLFAGTESSMYVSFDDGDDWQSLMLNLPNTSYRDIVVKDNDLVVATYGRSFYILDDFSPLRQMTPAIAAEAAHLFKPGDAIRVRRNVNGDTPFPPEVPHALNPPLGAIIYYYLGSKPRGDISIDILDAAGRTVRHMSSAPIPPITDPPAPVPDWWLDVPKPLPTEIGTNRINWNIRYDNPPAFNHNFAQVMGAVPGDTPYTPEGPLALPGVYTVRLTVDGKSYTQTVTVRNDPRSPATLADLQAQHDIQMKLYDGARESWDGWHQVAQMRDAVAAVLHANPPAEVATAATAFDGVLARQAGSPAIVAARGGRGAGSPPTFASLNGTEPGESAVLTSMNGQLKTLDFADFAPNEPMRRAWLNACTDLRTVVTNWHTTNARDLPAFNAVLARNNLKPIAAAVPVLPMPVCMTAAPAPAAAGHGQ